MQRMKKINQQSKLQQTSQLGCVSCQR